MVDYVIPCETLTRLMSVATDKYGPWFDSVRIDNGLAVASNSKFVVCERLLVDVVPGVIHIRNDAALMAQCAQEAPWNSNLTITVLPEFGLASAKTTLGYLHTANPVIFDAERSKFDGWRQVFDRVREPAPEASGAMYWNTDTIVMLSRASPSGAVVFEERIDANRGALLRDSIDPNWCAILASYPEGEDALVTPATLPAWLTA
jgi:hypothetical protein